jgi:hypothetical protein
MKTQQANMGLGDAVSSRRNPRVQRVDKRGWKFKRIAFFQRNVRKAAAAKAFRTAMDVTQHEVGMYFGVSQGTACNWESGKYSWPGGAEELNEYIDAVRRIAASRGRPQRVAS